MPVLATPPGPGMRTTGTYRLLALSAVVVALVGCGQQTEVRSVADSTDVASLREVEWQLRTMSVDGAPRDVAAADAVLRVSASDAVTGRACNHFGGAGTIGPGTLRVTSMSTTLMGCMDVRQEIDDVTGRLLRDGARWSITDGTLVLTGGGARLTYGVRPSPWRNPTATPLLEGSFGPAVYRLAWQYERSNDSLGVDWESRERPGEGLSSSGIGRFATEDITYLDPSGVTVAGHGFGFVPAPIGVDRVVWKGPGGDVALKPYELPHAKTWHLFAGFVDGPMKGGQAVGYTGGEEKLRSRVLPY